MAEDAYFPPPAAAGSWAHGSPGDLGLREDALRDAIGYAHERALRWPRDVGRLLARVEPPPHDAVLGPTRERGGTAGVVLRGGRIAAEWGDPGRADMTFSAAKSYLSLLAGVAHDRGLLPDVREPVRARVDDGGFDPPNDAITWEHLLQQTSEWQGTLFGLPDTVDHHRSAGEGAPPKGTPRALCPPGAYWEYNDVRVNRLALALLRLFREPLPAVLRRAVMDPIGASDGWAWHAYWNAWVDLDGRRVPSVPGGAHWGGGIFISSHDHARVGLLALRRGAWEGRRILSEAWLDAVTRPCARHPGYGYLWWLNTGRRLFPGASERAFAARGAGGNAVVVEPERDLVIVTRWVADVAGVVDRVAAAAE